MSCCKSPNVRVINKLSTTLKSIHQDLYQKLTNCFSNYIPINMIKNILIEEDLDLVIDEVINHEDFGKSDIEIETYDPINELKYLQ